MTAEYDVAKNARESVKVRIDCGAVSTHREGKTAVRVTDDGRYAVFSFDGGRGADGAWRLIKTFPATAREHACRYNFAIHGDKY